MQTHSMEREEKNRKKANLETSTYVDKKVSYSTEPELTQLFQDETSFAHQLKYIWKKGKHLFLSYVVF